MGGDGGPHVGDFGDVVLAQHIEGAHEVWAVAGEFEAAELEAHTVARCEDPVWVDFKPNDFGARIDAAQPARPLAGGGVGGAVADVDG